MIFDLIDKRYLLRKQIEAEMKRVFPVGRWIMYKKGNMKVWAHGTVAYTGYDTDLFVRRDCGRKVRKISVFDVRKTDVVRNEQKGGRHGKT